MLHHTTVAEKFIFLKQKISEHFRALNYAPPGAVHLQPSCSHQKNKPAPSEALLSVQKTHSLRPASSRAVVQALLGSVRGIDLIEASGGLSA